MAIWRKVYFRISGANDSDSKILRRAIRGAPLTIWRDLNQWQFPMVDEDCTVLSEGVGVFRVRGKTDDLFHVLRGQEKGVETIVRDSLREGDTFVDAGANVGYYSILASRLIGSSGRVIACEMMPETAAILRAHAKMNKVDNITVIEAALGNTASSFVDAYSPKGKSGQSSITRRLSDESTQVPTMRLEEVLAEVGNIKLMKMDIEGAELGALQGLGKCISKVEAIVFENRDAPEVIKYLVDHGFQIKRIDGNNVLAYQALGAL